MRWASAISNQASFEGACSAIRGQIRDSLGKTQTNLGLVFGTPHHEPDLERSTSAFAPLLAPGGTLLGCSGGGVIGANTELEQLPGLSFVTAELPDVELHARHVDAATMPGPDATKEAWEAALGIEAVPNTSLVLLADPYTFDTDALIQALNTHWPDVTIVGGLASGGGAPGANLLLCNDRTYRTGAVVLRLRGKLRMRTLVAQGCRPIGRPHFITDCEGNFLRGLDGQPAAAVLHQIYEQLDASDKALLRSALFLGLSMREQVDEYRLGDFLIRNVVGFDRRSGAFIVGAALEQFQVVQFHVRDAKTSHDELTRLLERHRDNPPGGGPSRPDGALLFSCLGRGEGLYGAPDHDVSLFHDKLGPTPVGGFFCNGEIGPIQGRTYIHGYTSSFALFTEQ